MQDTRIHIDSEIGKLNAVMVHRPGREIENMTPASAAEVLYDDILNLQLAVREHDQLTGVLGRVAEVYEFEDLLRDTLADVLTLARLNGERSVTLWVNKDLEASVVTVAEDVRQAVEAMQLMQKHAIQGLLVIDHEGRLVGALNFQDLLRAGVV